MFREAAGALSRQPSQDNGLDGPFSSGASKLEQVPYHLTCYKNHRKTVSTQIIPKVQRGLQEKEGKKIHKGSLFVLKEKGIVQISREIQTSM